MTRIHRLYMTLREYAICKIFTRWSSDWRSYYRVDINTQLHDFHRLSFIWGKIVSHCEIGNYRVSPNALRHVIRPNDFVERELSLISNISFCSRIHVLADVRLFCYSQKLWGVVLSHSLQPPKWIVTRKCSSQYSSFESPRVAHLFRQSWIANTLLRMMMTIMITEEWSTSLA